MSWKLESNDYSEVKRKFESSSRGGYNHILFWIVSIAFYNDYLTDCDKMKGRRILINSLGFDFSNMNKAENTLAGYDIVISDKFSKKYGISFVLFSGLDEENRGLI